MSPVSSTKLVIAGGRWLAFCLGLAVSAGLVPIQALAASEGRFDQADGLAAPGVFYRRLAYEGRDPLVGDGDVRWRLGRGVALFGDRGAAARRGWQVDYRTAVRTHGAGFKLFASEADRDLSGAQELGFDAGDLGLSRRDLAGEWRGGKLAASVRHDTAQSVLGPAGVGRLATDLEAFGLRWRRDELQLDEGLALGGSTEARLLGDRGYALGARRLGTAQGGLRGLNRLAGLRDRLEALSLARGALTVEHSTRRLTRRGAALADSSQRLKYKGLALERTERALDAHFTGEADAGYAHLGYLRGAREVREAVQADVGLVAGSLARTRQTGETGPTADAPVSERLEGGLQLRPSSKLSVAWTGSELRSGAARDWDAGREEALRRSDDQRIEIGLRDGEHRLHLRGQRWTDRAPDGRGLAQELEARYEAERTAALTLLGREETRFGSDPQAAPQHRELYSLALRTDVGLRTASRWERRAAQGDGWYQGVALQPALGKRCALNAGVDYWNRLGDDAFRIAGRERVLQAGADWAMAYRIGARVKPGSTEIAAEQRELRYDPLGDDEAVRRLSETSLNVAQDLFLDLRARGAWTRYETEQGVDRERREAALGFAPAGEAAPLKGEVGYRELRLRSGEARPALFATARLAPGLGLALEGEVAQQPRAGGDWSSPDQRTMRVAASQSFAGDGLARAQYSRTPQDERATVMNPTLGPLAEETTLEVATPSRWLLGLQLRGRYRQRLEPLGADDHHVLTEQTASVNWQAGGLGTLSASYAVRDRQQRTLRDGDSRVELQYRRALGDEGRFVLSGWLNDRVARVADDPQRERYRVGMHYALPF